MSSNWAKGSRSNRKKINSKDDFKKKIIYYKKKNMIRVYKVPHRFLIKILNLQNIYETKNKIFRNRNWVWEIMIKNRVLISHREVKSDLMMSKITIKAVEKISQI